MQVFDLLSDGNPARSSVLESVQLAYIYANCDHYIHIRCISGLIRRSRAGLRLVASSPANFRFVTAPMAPKRTKRKAVEDAEDDVDILEDAKKQPKAKKAAKVAKESAPSAESSGNGAKDKAPPAEAPGDAGYWLMKAEADSRLHNGKDVRFSIDDLAAVTQSAWDGVRNYAARNHMQSMKVGDRVLFYHSNCKVPGVAGLASVSREAFPDPSAFDKDHAYYDVKSKPEKPTWYCVEVRFEEKFPVIATLHELKALAQTPGNPLSNMVLFKPGRLSVQPVTKAEYEYIVQFAKGKATDEK